MILTKLTRPVLVLNKHWVAIGTSPVFKVMNLLQSGGKYNPKAHVIDESCTPHTWEEWSVIKPERDEDSIFTVTSKFKIPQIIRLTKNERYPSQKVTFSRSNIFKRDGYKCQYCGIKPGSEELTIDHVQPRSKGGKTTWDNCVLSCIDCNSIKGDKLLNQIKHRKFPNGMKLLKIPVRPKAKDIKFHIYHNSWKQWIDTAYWSVELENDLNERNEYNG